MIATQLESQLNAIKAKLFFDQKISELQSLQSQSQQPEFWSNSENSSQTMKQIASLEKIIQKIQKTATDIEFLLSLEQDPDTNPADIDSYRGQLEKQISELEF